MTVTTEEQPAKPESRRKIKIAKVAEFPPGTRVEVAINRVRIAVFNIGGSYFAMWGRCPHQFAPLSRGRLQGTVVCNAETNWETKWAHEGEVVVCPGHGMEFDVRTGKAFGYTTRVKTYDVVVENGDVVLLM